MAEMHVCETRKWQQQAEALEEERRAALQAQAVLAGRRQAQAEEEQVARDGAEQAVAVVLRRSMGQATRGYAGGAQQQVSTRLWPPPDPIINLCSSCIAFGCFWLL
jgi:hypothetical protein